MSLDLGKLEKVRKLGNGVVQARCPACAEDGHDRAGQHLRIYADGRYGCCVYPGDGEHRKRIFALAGERQRHQPWSRQFTVKVPSAKPPIVVARSVRESLTEALFRTLRTGVSQSNLSQAGCQGEFRTLRTPILKSRAYARGNGNNTDTCKDTENGVLSVLNVQNPQVEKLPYLDASGGLVIPFDSPERYHYWKPDGKRMSVKETLAEVRGRMAQAEGDENHGTGV